MNDLFFPFDLSVFTKSNYKMNEDEIIKYKKYLSQILKESRNQAKQKQCYHCGTNCDGFCNSHTVPEFCLRNIAKNGKVFYSNSILEMPLLKDIKGVNEAGTFHLICKNCDNTIFQDYENPDNYENLPSIKMLAQIDMKNNLKNISKRLTEKELYNIVQKKLNVKEQWIKEKIEISNLDLQEFESDYRNAKKRSLKPFCGDYYIGYYVRLPYTVPIAFQGTIPLIFDLEGNIINNIYDKNPKYKIMNISLCIFPLKNISIIMMFVSKNNNRYARFFKQLKKLNSLDEQLNVINYILFSYCEDYFLSMDIPKNILENLVSLSGKTSDFFTIEKQSSENLINAIREIFNFYERENVPNLLSRQYALSDD